MERKRNVNTLRVGDASAPRLGQDALREIYDAAHRLFARAPAPLGAVGHRLYWFSGDKTGAFELTATDGMYAVVGRHKSCDVVMADDPELALRHLLLRSVPIEQHGTPQVALRVLDLRTALGFHLSDDAQLRSILATGPVAMRVGRYALVALPMGKPLPAMLPAPKLEKTIVSPYGTLAMQTPEQQALVAVLRRSAIIGESMESMLGDDGPPDTIPDGHAPVVARLIVGRSGQHTRVELRASDLDNGVIVGRSDKCADPGLRAILSDAVSRVHLLILRDNDVTYAYDVCSMHGTYVAGKRVRRHKLRHGSVLSLGGSAGPVCAWEQS